MNKIIYGDNLKALDLIPDNSITLTYIDPPFSSGKIQKRDRIKITPSEDGIRGGFGDKRYVVEHIDSPEFDDRFDDFEAFLMPRIEKSLNKLTNNGSIFIHLDFRQIHYIKVAMDKLMGKDHFINEIIWSFDFGAKSRKKYSNKHNSILWYCKDPKNYIFNYDQIDRVPYMSSLAGKEKMKKGKVITSVWWSSIVGTNSREKQNYPTQKPLKILNRIVKMHSLPGNINLDFFAGSGSFGEASATQGRSFIMIDSGIDAIDTMKKRLSSFTPDIINYNDNEK